ALCPRTNRRARSIVVSPASSIDPLCPTRAHFSSHPAPRQWARGKRQEARGNGEAETPIKPPRATPPRATDLRFAGQCLSPHPGFVGAGRGVPPKAGRKGCLDPPLSVFCL